MRINFNKRFSNQFLKSSAFEYLYNKSSPEIAKNRPNFEQDHLALNSLFGKSIPSDQAKKIFMVWGMTIFASRMTANINVSEDEDKCLNGINSSIKSLKKDLVWWVNHGTTFHINSLILGKEPNLNAYLATLEQLDSFVATCRINKKFGKGDEFNSDYIRKYGVFALFHLGYLLGLVHAKRDSPLFRFVEIITDLEKSQMSKYYKQYKEAEFNPIIKDNKLLFCIYYAYKVVLDSSVNPRHPPQFVTKYSESLTPNINQWC